MTLGTERITDGNSKQAQLHGRVVHRHKSCRFAVCACLQTVIGYNKITETAFQAKYE